MGGWYVVLPNFVFKELVGNFTSVQEENISSESGADMSDLSDLCVHGIHKE